MRLYSDEHLHHIGLRDWAYKNLESVPFDSNYTKITAHTYFIPTPEFEEMVKKNNVIFALKGNNKLCKPVYKSTYICRYTKRLVISSV